jgi:4'-phosphopantetheinyl transferase EntD
LTAPFPLTHCWLDFQEANITISPATIDHTEGTFSTRLLVTGPMIAGKELTGFDGRWLISDGLVITAIAVSPTQ